MTLKDGPFRHPAEGQAARWLEENQGWRLLRSNYDPGFGEIDLIMLEERAGELHLRFVEVKAWRDTRGDFAPAGSLLSSRKRQRYRRSARYFTENTPGFSQAWLHFDLVSVPPVSDDSPNAPIQWLPDCF